MVAPDPPARQYPNADRAGTVEFLAEPVDGSPKQALVHIREPRGDESWRYPSSTRRSSRCLNVNEYSSATAIRMRCG